MSAAHRATCIVAAVLGSALALEARAEEVVLEVEDPARDDHGPGGYTYPSRGDYERGDFDLRGLRIAVDGDDVRIEVQLRRPIRRLLEPRRSRAMIVPLDNRLTVQNVDVYLQNPDEALPRAREGIPGRRIAFAPGHGWTRAVIFTPQPGYVAHLLKPWPHAERTLVPKNLQSIGRRVWARIPVDRLGGRPGPGWGVAVAVSGALWENRYEFLRRPDQPDVVNALTMPVHVLPDFRRFGGGDMSGFHPNVIDVLAPSADAQQAILTSYDARAKTVAKLPMIRIRGPGD